MSAPTTRKGNLLIVSFLLLLAVLLEQFWIARYFPLVEAAGSIRPMIVFLDIPLPLPTIDWLPVTVIFVILYVIVITPGLSRTGERATLGKRVIKALVGWWLLFGCIAAAGGLYALVQEDLPKQVANGIDSVGLRTDLTLPYPSGELIHLHGSAIGLLFGLLGFYWMNRLIAVPHPAAIETTTDTQPQVVYNNPTTVGAKAIAEAQAIINTPAPRTPTTTILKTPRREPALAAEPATPAYHVGASQPSAGHPAATREPAPTSTATQAPTSRRSSVSVTPPSAGLPAQTPGQPPATSPVYTGEPPTCRLTTPPPIAVVMPRAAPGIGKTHPCFVIGGLKPKKS
jgi:hypothetical protein